MRVALHGVLPAMECHRFLSTTSHSHALTVPAKSGWTSLVQAEVHVSLQPDIYRTACGGFCLSFGCSPASSLCVMFMHTPASSRSTMSGPSFQNLAAFQHAVIFFVRTICTQFCSSGTKPPSTPRVCVGMVFRTTTSTQL